MKTIGFAVLMMSALAFAADVKPTPPQAASGVKLTCAAGSKQMTDGEGIFCNRGGAPGVERLEGPYVGVGKSGLVSARGQYVGGERVGHWVFFDEKGVKTHETDFVADQFSGKRIEFFPNGQKKVEETWVNGKRQGETLRFDPNGAPLTVAK